MTVLVLTHAGQLGREVRLAGRRLWATPVFTAFAVVSLSVGLGVTTAVYSTAGALFWSASSIEDADHLSVVTRQVPGAGMGWRGVISRPDFDELRSHVRSVPAVAASSAVVSALNDGAETSSFVVEAVTGNYFAMLPLPLYLGRGIEEADDRPGADPVVVLSHHVWQSKTGADRGVLGRTVRIGGHPFVVIGVVDDDGLSRRDLYGQYAFGGDGWIPLAARNIVTGVVTTPGDRPGLTVIARMPAGLSLQTVAAEAGAIGAALDRETPLPRGDSAAGSAPRWRKWSATTAGAIDREETAIVRAAGGGVVLLVSLVLLVACTNIANLTLGRGASRQHEFAVRRALGASRGRLIREQCAESAVLAALGGLGALLVTKVLLRSFTTDIPLGSNFQLIALQPRLNVTALIGAGGLLLVSLVVFGVVPAMHLTRASLNGRLASDASGVRPTRWRGRRRLIACQVAASTAFLLIAAASTRAVTADARHDPGFDLRHLAVGFVSLRSMHDDTARVQRAIEALDAAAHAQTGFESVALASGLPMGVGNRLRQVAQVSNVDGEQAFPVVAMPATPGIFRTLAVPMLRGRGFDGHDSATTKRVIVVSERVARQAFGTADAVGKSMIYQGAWETAPQIVEVIGVTRDTDPVEPRDRRFGSVYLPLTQQSTDNLIIVGRTAGNPAPMARTFSRIVRDAEPDLAVEFAGTGSMVMTPRFVVLRVAAIMSGGLSMLSVTLAMLGLYGVLSHIVASRTREIGLRLALGAEASQVRRMTVGDGMQPVIWGLGVGLFVGIGARGALGAVVSGLNISAIDPLAFGLATVTLVAAGLFACYLPARSASKVDPNVALRHL